MEMANTAASKDGSSDEYANTPVPESDKSVGAFSILNVMLGISTALIWFSLGSILVNAYGTMNFIIGAGVTALIVGVISFIWVNFSSKSGFNSDLITRASGFGYLGSTVTALIFAVNNLLYFGLEGGIMINAVHAYFPDIPVIALQIVFGLVFIPLTAFGIQLLSRIMWISMPILFLFFVWIAFEAASIGGAPGFWSISVSESANLAAGAPILQVMVAMFGISGIAATASDFGRFIPKRNAKIGGFLLGPVFTLFTFLVPLTFGAWLGASFEESDPAVYFTNVFGIFGVMVIIITQARINMNNVYSTAVGLATIANRLFNINLPRFMWVVITCLMCVVILTADLYSKATAVLGVWGIFLISWVGTVFADILFNRYLLKLTPDEYYYSQEQLRKVNPVGFVSLFSALIVAVPLSFGAAGPLGATIAPLVAFAITLIATPLSAYLTRGRFSASHALSITN